MIRRPPRFTRTYTLFPYTTLFRSESRKTGGSPSLLVRPANSSAQAVGAACHGRDWQRRVRSPRHLAPLRPEFPIRPRSALRSEEHTSELQSLMRISYAVFCLKKKNTTQLNKYTQATTDNTSN